MKKLLMFLVSVLCTTLILSVPVSAEQVNSPTEQDIQVFDMPDGGIPEGGIPEGGGQEDALLVSSPQTGDTVVDARAFLTLLASAFAVGGACLLAKGGKRGSAD